MMWEDDLERLVKEVEMFVTLRNHSREKETFQLFLERMEWEATDPHDIKVLADLNEWYLGGQRPAAFIVEHRDKLTIEDIARHFCFVRCRNLVLRKVESFDLLLPADEEYKTLFVNRASQELAFLLSTTIGMYVDFRHNYQYAALTDWTGKLLGSMFGAMDEHHLLGNYSKEDFEKMKDCYWLCLSIINKVVQLDLQELQFAPYLYEEHENTPSFTDYKNSEGQSIMERLSILKSVIKDETLFR